MERQSAKNMDILDFKVLNVRACQLGGGGLLLLPLHRLSTSLIGYNGKSYGPFW